MRALGFGLGLPFQAGRRGGGGGAPGDPTLALDLNFLTMTALDPRVTFTRAGTAMVYDATGKLTTASNNLAIQSENFTLSAWTKDATTFAAGVLTENTSTAAHRLHTGSSYTFPVGNRVNVSFEVKYVSCPWVAIVHAVSQAYYFNIQTGTLGTAGGPGVATITPLDAGFYRITVSDTVASGTMYGILNMANAAGNALSYTGTSRQVEVRRAQYEVVAYETAPRTYIPTTTAAVHGPRFDHDPATLQPRGLLLEEQRTNLLIHSQNFADANWQLSDVTKIGVAGVADPAGGSNAYEVAFGAGGGIVTGASALYQNHAGLSAAQSYAITFYVRAKTGTSSVRIGFYDGTINTGSPADIPITASVWTRISFTVSAGNPSSTGNISLRNNAAGTTGNVYVYGAQFELGAFPTSYIPTTAAAVTRAADTASMTGTDFTSWYNQSAGTFVAEFDAALGGSLGAGILSADDVSATRAIIFLKDNSNNARTDVSATTASFNNIVGTVTAGINKLGLSFAVNDFAACINNGTVILDTTGGLPVPIQFRLGFAPGGGTYLNGHVCRIRFWNTAKSDSELQALTT